MDSLIYFNNYGKRIEIKEIIIWTILIIISSQLLFISISKIFNVNLDENLTIEKNKEFEKWKEKGITPENLLKNEIISAVVAAPLIEEFLFKIVILKILFVEKLGINNNISAILSALLFSLAHLTNSMGTDQTYKYTKIQTIFSFLSGIISNFVFIHTNSIFPSLFAHIINNGLATLQEYIDYKKFKKDY